MPQWRKNRRKSRRGKEMRVRGEEKEGKDTTEKKDRRKELSENREAYSSICTEPETSAAGSRAIETSIQEAGNPCSAWLVWSLVSLLGWLWYLRRDGGREGRTGPGIGKLPGTCIRLPLFCLQTYPLWLLRA